MAESQLKQLLNLYESETSRLNSFFYNKWPQSAPVWPLLLAKAGFCYQGIGLNVKCFSCGIETSVTDWIRNIHPQKMHFKLNPDCEFIRSVLKSEGGPITFNDSQKWELSKEGLEKDNELGIKEETKLYHPDTLDSETRNFVVEDTPQSNIYQSSQVSQLTSHISERSGTHRSEESGYSTGSSIAVDSGPVGPFSRDSILVSGSSATRSLILPGHSGYGSHFSPTSLSSVMSVSDASIEPETSISRPDNVTFKHPDMETVTSRMESFQAWPHTDVQPSRILATAGFFFTMENDIVRCFCCDLGLSEWDANDDAWKEHARHSPTCWYLKRVKGQRYIDDIQRDWKKIYNPKFPNLMDETERVKTFHNWPNLISRPTSSDIAKAGFFYVGRGDECRCHYCDGGLQHWENDDNPWEQHAYYFAHCKYVIKMKGRDFIREVRERFDARGPEVDALIRESEELEAAKNRVDVRDRKIDEALLKPELKDIYNFGYSKKAVKMACVEIFNQRGDFNFTPEQILNMILDLQDRGEDVPGDGDEEEDEKQGEATPAKPLLPAGEFMKTINQQEPLEDAIKVLEENKALKEGMRCWKCKKEEICMLFTPCGHRLTCENCSKNINYCLKCNKRVKKRYKTFLA